MVVVKKTRSNQITLPRQFLRQARLDRQEYFQADLRGGAIYLMPLRIERPLDQREEARFVAKLRALERRERGKGKRFSTPEAATAYLKTLA